jgi:hypothetical protein
MELDQEAADSKSLGRRLAELEQVAAVLNEFAFRMSSSLSTAEKRMHHPCMMRVVVHEPQLKDSVEVILDRVASIEAFLSAGGLRGPPQRPGRSIGPFA